MAQLEGYDTEVQPADFDRFATRDHPAHIEEIVRKEVSATEDKGRMLEITWKLDDGPYQGRLCWQKIMLWFKGPEKEPGKVATIAAQQWAEVRAATVGLDVLISDTDQFPVLYHRPCLITHGPQKNNPDYDQVSRVKANAGPAARSAPPASRGPAPSQQRGPAPGKAPAPAGKANPFGHLKSGAQQREMVDDDIPF